MSILYNLLLCKKGPAYRDSQIADKSYLRRFPDIDKTASTLAGNSRVVGDASPEVQKRIIEKVIEVGVRYQMSYRDIAFMLLMAKVESGFNPDAAAGTTSAGGLSQYVDGLAADVTNGKDAKRILGFSLDLTRPKDRFDAEKGIYGLLISYVICKEKATSFNTQNPTEYIYIFHHDGWNSNLNKRGPELRDSYKIYINKIKPLLSKIEAELKANHGLQFVLKDADGAPKAGQPYVVVLPKQKPSQRPGAAQESDVVRVIKGTTDGQGRTQPIQSKGVGEVVFGILNSFALSKLKGQAEVERSDKYTVKRGDTLGRIAKASNTSIEELAKANDIKDANCIPIGKELVLPAQPIPRKPDKSLMTEVLRTLGLEHADVHIFEYVRSHVIQPHGSVVQPGAMASITALRSPVKPTTPKQKPKVTQTVPDRPASKEVPVIRSNSKVEILINKDVQKRELISEHTKTILRQIGEELGIETLYITSGLRPPDRQAKTMYANIQATGVAAQKDMYSAAGDAVVGAYVNALAAGKIKGEIIAAMEAEIIRLSENGKRVSKHCVSEAQYKKLNVIDVSPRTIPRVRHKAMKAKLVSLKAQGLVEKFIIPGEVKGEPAYHIEIPQP
jgi:LysM repeat protein